MNIEKLQRLFEKMDIVLKVRLPNGLGFDPQYAAKIFEVFEQLTSKHKTEGTGIGFAVFGKSS